MLKLIIYSKIEPYREESLVTKYAIRIKENREKRKKMGEDVDNEPTDLIYDTFTPACFDDGEGRKIYFDWKHTNLISSYCV